MKHQRKHIIFTSIATKLRFPRDLTTLVHQYSEPLFITRWEIPRPDFHLRLPFHRDGEYDCFIQWEDQANEAFHIYTNPGVKTIRIKGLVHGFTFAQAEGHYSEYGLDVCPKGVHYDSAPVHS